MSVMLLLSFVVSCSAIVFLTTIYHNVSINIYVKISAMVPLITECGFSLTWAILLNNYLFPQFDENYNLIDRYCTSVAAFLLFFSHLHQYSTWFFYLSRIYYFFKSSPNQLATKTYYILNIIIFVSSVIGCIDSITHAEMTIYYASDDNKYKMCHFSTDINPDIGFILSFDVFIQSLFLYLFCKKIKQLENAINAGNYDLSTVYSQNNDENILTNPKIMKRSLMFGIIFIIYHAITIVLFLLFRIRFCFAIIPIMSTFSIVSSFVEYECNCSTCTETNDTSDMDREKYLQKLMNAYYSTPTRNITRVTVTH
eukprot:193502_1